MTDLEEKIIYYADSYYNGNELISDAEYDSLIELLKKENPSSKLLNTVIGDDLKGVTKKIKHPYLTTGTLAKIHTEQEFITWYDKNNKVDYIVETKEDGNGQDLVYKDGKLIQVISRGDGFYGEDTTENVIKVQGVVKEISGFNGSIRGEVTLKNSVFKQFFVNDANPRNTAAGIIKRKDGKNCEKLNFIAYDVFDIENKCDKTELDKLAFLQAVGFETPKWWSNTCCEDIIEIRNNIPKLVNELDRGIDGVVIKPNVSDRDDWARKQPMKSIAFKPEATVAITRLKDIEWQLSGSIFSPVGILEPVEIDGAVVSRVTLHNLNIMNQLMIGIGDKVEVIRSGMVIPSIVKVVESNKLGYNVPSKCPVCGGPVDINSSGFPICTNIACPRKISHQFAKIFEVLGIKETGDAFLNKLEVNKIGITDFFELIKNNNEKKLCELSGGINGKKILVQMSEKLKEPISIARFLALFDYKGFDEKKLKVLDLPLEDLYNISMEKLMGYDGFAEITSIAFIEFMKNKKSEIEELRQYFNITSNVSNNGIIVFTGSGPLSRNELSDLAVKNNWEVGKSVTKKTNILVCEDVNSNSSKLQAARKNGTKIISYEEFLNLIK